MRRKRSNIKTEGLKCGEELNYEELLRGEIGAKLAAVAHTTKFIVRGSAKPVNAELFRRSASIPQAKMGTRLAPLFIANAPLCA
jgi:hypothetical protein